MDFDSLDAPFNSYVRLLDIGFHIPRVGSTQLQSVQSAKFSEFIKGS